MCSTPPSPTTPVNPVTDLKEEDFQVLEDRTPQTILHFEPPASSNPDHPAPNALSAGPVESSADLDRIGNRPVTLILLDELNMSFAEEVYAREQVQHWIEAQPAVLDNPTLLLALTYNDLRVLQDTTQNRDKLLHVLKTHAAGNDWRYGNVGVVEGAASDATAETLGALDHIAQSMRGLPGRKNLFWVGDGFRSFLATDVSAQSAKEIDAHLRSVEQNLFRCRVSLSVMGNTVRPPNTFTHKQTLSQVLGGIVDFALVDPDGSFAFNNLAAPTGGKAFAGRNDLTHELAEQASASQTAYTLTYSPTEKSATPTKFRKIEVRVLRHGLTVQTGSGYFSEPSRDPAAAPATPSRQQLAFDFYGAGFSKLPYTDLHVRPTRLDPDHWIVRVRAAEIGWHYDATGVRKADDVVLAMCFSKSGQMLSRTFHDVGANTKALDVQLLGAQVELHFPLKAPPATTRIRFVVRDTVTGRVGTADATP